MVHKHYLSSKEGMGMVITSNLHPATGPWVARVLRTTPGYISRGLPCSHYCLEAMVELGRHYATIP